MWEQGEQLDGSVREREAALEPVGKSASGPQEVPEDAGTPADMLVS